MKFEYNEVFSCKRLRTCAINHIQLWLWFVLSSVHLLFASFTQRLSLFPHRWEQVLTCSFLIISHFPGSYQKRNWNKMKMRQEHSSVHKDTTKYSGWDCLMHSLLPSLLYSNDFLETTIHTNTNPKQILIIFSVNLF